MRTTNNIFLNHSWGPKDSTAKEKQTKQSQHRTDLFKFRHYEECYSNFLELLGYDFINQMSKSFNTNVLARKASQMVCDLCSEDEEHN